MKCPKCGYLGFETSDRCRNCGYDFSLSVTIEAPELPLHDGNGPGAPLADFDLSGLDMAPLQESPADLDLDRVIGFGDMASADASATPAPRVTPPALAAPPPPPSSAPPRTARAGSPARSVAEQVPQGAGETVGVPARQEAVSRRHTPPPAPATPDRPAPLPFGRDEEDDTPLITTPRPVRPPLAVRRTTPEIPRGRATVTPSPRPSESGMWLELESEEAAARVIAPPAAQHAARAKPVTPELPPATPGARLIAAAVDVVLLALINAAVVYFTLAVTGLGMEQWSVLPVAPFAGFFAMLDLGYLIAFIAASGQTIGKMVTGIRVIGDDDRRVDIAGAVLRALGVAGSLVTAGLGYLPAFITADRRALQDRIAGTRVVSAR